MFGARPRLNVSQDGYGMNQESSGRHTILVYLKYVFFSFEDKYPLSRSIMLKEEVGHPFMLYFDMFMDLSGTKLTIHEFNQKRNGKTYFCTASHFLSAQIEKST